MGLVQPGGAPTGACESFLQLVPDHAWTTVGTLNLAGTVGDCGAACMIDPLCTSYEFTTANMCFLHTETAITLTPSAAANVFVKLWYCMGAIFICYPNLALGTFTLGSLHTLASPDLCLNLCKETAGCVSVDFRSDVAGDNCRLYTSGDDQPLNALTTSSLYTHYKIVMVLSPSPCYGPPPECTMTTDPCTLPADQTCGVGQTQQLWDCNHGNAFLPTLFSVTRNCCDNPCTAGVDCRNPSTEQCALLNPLTATDCWAAGCCWIPADPTDMFSVDFCAKKRIARMFTQRVVEPVIGFHAEDSMTNNRPVPRHSSLVCTSWQYFG